MGSVVLQQAGRSSLMDLCRQKLRYLEQGIVVVHECSVHHRANVGAGLLANAVDHSTVMPTDTASSRARSAPTGIASTGGYLVENLNSVLWVYVLPGSNRVLGKFD